MPVRLAANTPGSGPLIAMTTARRALPVMRRAAV